MSVSNQTFKRAEHQTTYTAHSHLKAEGENSSAVCKPLERVTSQYSFAHVTDAVELHQLCCGGARFLCLHLAFFLIFLTSSNFVFHLIFVNKILFFLETER